MGFADAFFDGTTILDGVVARRCATLEEMFHELRGHVSIPIVVGDLRHRLGTSNCAVLVDARMRKRVLPESHCGMAALTIGLGPGRVAQRTADVVVETIWGDRLAAVL